MSCLSDGAEREIRSVVVGEKDLSSSESASSITRWVTRERMLGSV